MENQQTNLARILALSGFLVFSRISMCIQCIACSLIIFCEKKLPFYGF
jgi:hypothetical protein